MMCIAIAAICYTMSCTKPGDVDLPPYEPKLVLHGYVALGDTFRIALGRTLKSEGLLARPEDTYVKNGWMVLYEGGVFLDSLKYDSASFRYQSSSRIAIAGKQYTIRAGAPGFPSIEAMSIAPAPISTNSVVRKRNTRRNSSGTWLDDITIIFNDPAGERNFYLATLEGRYGGMCVHSYDPSVEVAAPDLVAFGETNCIDNDRIMYNDKTFNGTTKQLTISGDDFALEPYQDLTNGQVYRSVLKRYHVTEDYYRYFRGAERPVLETTGPGFFEPVMIKANVKNGFGLFTVYSMSIDSLY